MGWMQVVLGLHLTLYYSLRFTRGAMVLAIATLLIGNAMFGITLAWTGIGTEVNEALCITIAMVLLGLCLLLQRAIGQRVRVLVAEG